MKIYTRSGDKGGTSLYGGGGRSRVTKSHPRILVGGALDELNANLGLAAVGHNDALNDLIITLQYRVFEAGADVCSYSPDSGKPPALPPGLDKELEGHIDAFDKNLEQLRYFILSGGSERGARLHIARTVCRRAECALVAMAEGGDEPPPGVLAFINRLSDLLFMMAREANRIAGIPDVQWVTKREVFKAAPPKAE